MFNITDIMMMIIGFNLIFNLNIILATITAHILIVLNIFIYIFLSLFFYLFEVLKTPFDLQILIKCHLQTAKKYIKNNYHPTVRAVLRISLISGDWANERQMALQPPITLTPLRRHLIYINVPSVVVKELTGYNEDARAQNLLPLFLKYIYI